MARQCGSCKGNKPCGAQGIHFETCGWSYTFGKLDNPILVCQFFLANLYFAADTTLQFRFKDDTTTCFINNL